MSVTLVEMSFVGTFLTSIVEVFDLVVDSKDVETSVIREEESFLFFLIFFPPSRVGCGVEGTSATFMLLEVFFSLRQIFCGALES